MHIFVFKVLYISAQIDIVRQKLSEITTNDIKCDVTYNVVKTLVVRHEKIISFSNNIETLFSNIALVQIIANMLVLCCLGFLMVYVSSRVEILQPAS